MSNNCVKLGRHPKASDEPGMKLKNTVDLWHLQALFQIELNTLIYWSIFPNNSLDLCWWIQSCWWQRGSHPAETLDLFSIINLQTESHSTAQSDLLVSSLNATEPRLVLRVHRDFTVGSVWVISPSFVWKWTKEFLIQNDLRGSQHSDQHGNRLRSVWFTTRYPFIRRPGKRQRTKKLPAE